MTVYLLYLNLIALASALWPFDENGSCDRSDVECYGKRLYEIYLEEILPIEKETLFNELALPPLTLSHFSSPKPIILLIGQYSSGKTTFADLLIGAEYSGQFITLAPGTSDFIFISGISHECDDNDDNDDKNNDDNNPNLTKYEKIIHETPNNSDGKYFVMNSKIPFNIYQYFSGTEVIKNMKAAFVDSDFLRDAYVIDSPGILMQAKDSCDWFQFYNTLYSQSDLIIFIFDPYKPSNLWIIKDIFLLLKKYVNKVRFVINKIDSLSFRSLLDVYGATQYNLGKAHIFESLEINRFYLTSLWDEPCKSNDTSLCDIVKKDKNDLFKEIYKLKNRRFKIETKIKSLSERIEENKKHIEKIEMYTLYQCECGYVSCSCDDNKKFFDKSKSDICYNNKMKSLIGTMEKKRNRDISKLQDLRSTYSIKLSDAQKKLNKLAETLQ